MKKNHLKFYPLIVKFTDVQAENFYFQVKFINFYLREIISFTNEIDIRDWGQSKVPESAKMQFHRMTLLDVLGKIAWVR